MSAETTQTNSNSEFDFDPDALREKYRIERDKRLRRDGNDQYREVTGDFSHYIDDPYVEPGFERESLHDSVEVVVIGGGFCGLMTAARLREAGVEQIRIIESAGDFGGTWYWNRYPGAQCDIESYIYMPLLEELGVIPTEKYAHGPEILAHAQAIGRHYDLYQNACFQTQVTELRWDETAKEWIISTQRGDQMRAGLVFMANGPLSRPKLPGIPGVEKFKGHSFHTSRWDYDYTGGDSSGGLDRLRDKRVGVIGTGATAIQCVPHLGEGAQQLYVFQRTPSSVDKRGNAPTDPEFVRSLEPGWQKDRMSNFNIIVGGGYQDQDLVSDGWTDLFRNLVKLLMAKDGDFDLTPEEIAKKAEIADFQKMEEIRGRIDGIIDDPQTAESLKPYYRQFCKRPCFHDDYLPTFNRDSVELVDTQGRGVEAITERGVIVDGKEYELDCLIFATGFEVGTSYQRRAGYDIIGREGTLLSEKWAKNGLSTFHGFFSNGFPNCFFMVGMQSGLTPNIPHLISEQADHVAHIVKEYRKRKATSLEATADAERGWVETIKSSAGLNGDFQESCTPGYYNNEGKPGEGDGWFGGSYGEGSEAYFKILRDWREANTLEGIEFD